jgi:hypothetical protein
MAALANLLLCLAAPSWGLAAAAAKVDITPDLARPVRLAGFGVTGRRPAGVHDPLYARLLLLADGPRRVAIVGVDLIGLYRRQVEEIRALAGFRGPRRYLFLAATHTHSGPDTLGLWGPWPGKGGVDPAYQNDVAKKIAETIKRLEKSLAPVRSEGYRGRLDPTGLCRDRRDPAVLDPNLSALRLLDARGRAVATIVNWSCHPEALGRDNRLISADYPGQLCAEVERSGGGECLFLNGAIGGLLTVDAKAGADGFAESRRVGAAVARAVLSGLAKASSKEPYASLDFRSTTVRLPVQNSLYLIFLRSLAFGHVLFDSAGNALAGKNIRDISLRSALGRLREDERPLVETEVAIVDIGPARLLGFPGEIFPELVLGGYDGSLRFGRPLTRADNPNPPDLIRAPRPPYLEAAMGRPVPMVVGLANDELGYLVPDYDFKTNRGRFMHPRPAGDHYEETNSIGAEATQALLRAAENLLNRRGRG